MNLDFSLNISGPNYELPLEVTSKILKNLPIDSLLNFLYIDKTWHSEITRILNASEKLTLVDGLINVKYFKTALLAVHKFQLNEERIYRTFIKKFEINPSFDLFLLAGIFRPLEKAEYLFFEPTFSIAKPESYHWIKNISPAQITKIQAFLLSYKGVCFEKSACIYQAYKVLYVHGLIKKIELDPKFFFALAHSDKPQYFIDFLQIAPVELLSESQEDALLRIHELIQLNPMVALLEVASNQSRPLHREIYSYWSTHIEEKINQTLVYNIFNTQTNNHNIEEYLALAKSQERVKSNLANLFLLLFLESCQKKDKQASLLSMKWLLMVDSLFDATKYFKNFIDDYAFEEWSHLLDLLTPDSKSFVVKMMNALYFQGDDKSPIDFINALYCMRYLETLSYREFQGKAVACLERHDQKWKEFKGFFPFDLQEDLGNLIDYVLSLKDLKNDLNTINIARAEIILSYMDSSEGNQQPYLKAIEEAKEKERMKILDNSKIVKDEGWLTNLDSHYYFDEEDLIYPSDTDENTD